MGKPPSYQPRPQRAISRSYHQAARTTASKCSNSLICSGAASCSGGSSTLDGLPAVPCSELGVRPREHRPAFESGDAGLGDRGGTALALPPDVEREIQLIKQPLPGVQGDPYHQAAARRTLRIGRLGGEDCRVPDPPINDHHRRGRPARAIHRDPSPRHGRAAPDRRSPRAFRLGQRCTRPRRCPSVGRQADIAVTQFKVRHHFW